MDRCISLEEIYDEQLGLQIGEDSMGYPIYDSDTVLVGTYCSHFDEDNPDCEHCKSFYPV